MRAMRPAKIVMGRIGGRHGDLQRLPDEAHVLGWVDPEGRYYNRAEAFRWVQIYQPTVAKHLKTRLLESSDYNQAMALAGVLV